MSRSFFIHFKNPLYHFVKFSVPVSCLFIIFYRVFRNLSINNLMTKTLKQYYQNTAIFSQYCTGWIPKLTKLPEKQNNGQIFLKNFRFQNYYLFMWKLSILYVAQRAGLNNPSRVPIKNTSIYLIKIARKFQQVPSFFLRITGASSNIPSTYTVRRKLFAVD